MSALDHLSADQLVARRPAQAEPTQAGGGHAMLDLQPRVGNAAISRLVERHGAEDGDAVQAKHDPDLQRAGAPEEDELQAKHDPALQRAAAPEEEEAEGEEAMAKHDPALQRAAAPEEEEAEGEEAMAKHDPDLQRAAAPEEEEAEGEEAMAKHDSSLQRAPEVGLAGGPVSGGLASRIESQRGGGQPLDTGTQSAMEGQLGTSLDGVRVHVGGESDELNRSITAQAFTTGNDVFVRSDKYQPGSADTQRLLAHEVTHVAQQREMSPSGGGMTVGAHDTSHEQQADEVAEAAVSRMLAPEAEPQTT